MRDYSSHFIFERLLHKLKVDFATIIVLELQKLGQPGKLTFVRPAITVEGIRIERSRRVWSISQSQRMCV